MGEHKGLGLRVEKDVEESRSVYVKTNGGQVLWVKGVYGSGCVISGQRLEDRVRDVDFIQKKLSDMKESLSKDPLARLTKASVYGDRVVRLFETETIQGTAFPIDGVLDETYSNCPEAIMEDVVRCGQSLEETYLALG